MSNVSGTLATVANGNCINTVMMHLVGEAQLGFLQPATSNRCTNCTNLLSVFIVADRQRQHMDQTVSGR